MLKKLKEMHFIFMQQDFRLPSLNRESPSTRDQKLFALAIIGIVPSWRYPGTSEGIVSLIEQVLHQVYFECKFKFTQIFFVSQDVLYDEVNRCGLIQVRLRDLHKNLKSPNTETGKPKTGSKRSIDSGGPSPKIPKVIDATSISEPRELIDELNALCPKEGSLNIKRLLAETLAHRNILRTTNSQSILTLYRKFTECDYLVRKLYLIGHN